MRTRAWWLLAVAVAVLAACHRGGGEEDEEKAGPRRVRCAPAVSREVSDQREIRGTVAPLPDRDAQVSAQVAGRIARLLVREGDAVKAGQPLAQIDVGPMHDEVAAARATLARARAERESADSTLRRVQRVFERGIASRQELEDAGARAKAAAAGEAQEAAGARRAQLQVERGIVRSPFAGVILKIMRRTGELADGTPATPILEVGDPAVLELVGDAPGADLVRLQRGAPATITFPALGGASYPGQVAAVSPAVDRATGLGVVRVGLQQPKEQGAPPIGSFGVAHIRTGKARAAVTVPVVALRNASGPEAEIVLCGADHKAHVARVRAGVRDGDRVEVTGGVKAGDSVAVEPVLGIVDGDQLEVAAAAVPAAAAAETR
jgi:RND family efflux transporter MFP subunit